MAVGAQRQNAPAFWAGHHAPVFPERLCRPLLRAIGQAHADKPFVLHVHVKVVADDNRSRHVGLGLVVPDLVDLGHRTVVHRHVEHSRPTAVGRREKPIASDDWRQNVHAPKRFDRLGPQFTTVFQRYTRQPLASRHHQLPLAGDRGDDRTAERAAGHHRVATFECLPNHLSICQRQFGCSATDLDVNRIAINHRRADATERLQRIAKLFGKIDSPFLLASFRVQANQHIPHTGDDQIVFVTGRGGPDPIAIGRGEERHRHRPFPLRRPNLLAGFQLEGGHSLELLIHSFSREHQIARSDRPAVAWPQFDFPNHFQPVAQSFGPLAADRLAIALRATPLAPRRFGGLRSRRRTAKDRQTD